MLKFFIVNSIVIATAVFIHYEALLQLSRWLPRMRHVGYRFRIVTGVIGAMTAHTLEIWMFGIVYFLMTHLEGFGTIRGTENLGFLDCVYFSFITYSSLGYGDLIPDGGLRYLAGLEALTGLLLIAWTASFLFFEMERYWKNG
jgi:hypothetical protein